VRTGREYLESLNDGRFVYAGGERVADVSRHPGFEAVANVVATMYELASDPSSEMGYESPDAGTRVNKVFMIPRSKDDLAERRQAITKWAEVNSGFLGRSPDHVAGFLAGFASGADLFNRNGRELGENVLRFYRRAASEDLFLSYVIVPPQVDASLAEEGAAEGFYQVGVERETDEGIVVRGAQMLGTSTAISDYLFVSCIKPLAAEEEKYALSFAVPVNSPGLKVYCRRLYATDQPSSFDYPLSTRFDETDSLVVFDEVLVPWENVFVYRDVEMTRNQFFATAAHVLGNTQAQIRLVTKLKFVIGVARKVAEANGVDKHPGVQERLGELAAVVAIVEGMVLAAEASATTNAQGVAVPNPRFLYGAMGLQAELYPRVLQGVREISGAGMIQVPSSHQDLADEEARDDLLHAISSSDTAAVERIRLFKLAWDLVGSEFGGRHHQYEMFYAGAPFVTKGYSYRNYGYEEAVKLVDDFLAAYKPEGVTVGA
jgi:4-hydroxyphenylacetate 3-monooxygenase